MTSFKNGKVNFVLLEELNRKVMSYWSWRIGKRFGFWRGDEKVRSCIIRCAIGPIGQDIKRASGECFGVHSRDWTAPARHETGSSDTILSLFEEWKEPRKKQSAISLSEDGQPNPPSPLAYLVLPKYYSTLLMSTMYTTLNTSLLFHFMITLPRYTLLQVPINMLFFQAFFF